MFEHYLFHDRDLDTNLIFSVAYMVFGHGEACAYASTHAGLYDTILDVARAWYTNQVYEQRLTIPPALESSRLETETQAFRGKKGVTIFGHVRVLFRHEEMQRLIVSSPDMFNKAVDLLNLFVGIQTQKREHGDHVEYEVDWPRSFAILGELARSCRELGESFKFATPSQLFAGLANVSHRIVTDMVLISSTLDPEKYQRPVEHLVLNAIIPGSKFELLQHNVAKTEAFSFHHYIQLVFAEMVKAIRTVVPFEDGKYDGATFAQVFERHVFGWPDGEDAERMKLMLIEWPMQSELACGSH